MEIRHYVTASGNDPYQQWLDGLKDVKGRVIIQRRIDRVPTETSATTDFVGMECGSCEYGPGYRVLRARGRDGRTFAVWRIKAISVG